MPVKIENLTDRPVLLRLNSGKTLHLAPHETSPEVRDAEVKGNDKFNKLKDKLHVITTHQAEKKGASSEKPKKEKSKSTKKDN